MRDRPRNYLELLYTEFFRKEIKGNPIPYGLGSTADLTCINGWTLLPGSPSVQTCVSVNGTLVWTEPGICVYRKFISIEN